MIWLRWLSVTPLVVLLPTVAQASSLVVCHVGGPGSTAQAKPVLEKFIRHMEKSGGLDAGSMAGEYHTTKAGCLAYIKNNKPAFGVFDLATYLEHHKAWKLRPLASMGTLKSQRYHVLVREGSFKNLAALKGKTLISSHLADATLVSRIIFDGKLDAAAHFKLKTTRRPLKGIRKVARAKADATLVDQMAYEHLSELQLPAKLHAIHSSPKLPGLTLSTLGVNKPEKKTVDKLIRSLPKLCAGEGKKMCETFQITAFIKVKAGALKTLERKYSRK
jgi:hypothetical protein